MKHNLGKQGSFVYGTDEIDDVVTQFYPLFEQSAVITLTGSLGAGKTTFVQGLLRQAGVVGPVQSPTFTYVNIYKVSPELTIYHFDLYRLHTLAEFAELGFHEYLYQSGTKAIIEWPAIVTPFLKHGVCDCVLEYEGLDMRRLSYQCR